MRAINYLRWSSEKQNQGSSLGRQREKYREFTARMGWVDHEPEVLDDAVSGWSGENLETGNLSKLLGRLKREGGGGRVVVVENMDRASRLDVATVLRFVFDLIDTGASLALIDDAMVIDKLSIRNQTEQIKKIVDEAQRARSEGDRKSSLSRAGWSAIRLGKEVVAEFAGEITEIVRFDWGVDITISAKRRMAVHEISELAAGYQPVVGDYVAAQQPLGRIARKTHTGNTCPAWLTLTPCRRAFLLRHERIATLVDICQMRANGLSYTAICRKLNERGTQTFRGGNGWQSSAVKALVRNRALIGEYQHQSRATGETIGDPVPDYFPRIVSNEVFQAANDLRLAAAMPKRGGEIWHRNLLADLAVCEVCGSRMRFNRKTRRGGKDETYYQCSNYDRRMGCSHSKMYRGEPIVTALLDRVLHLAMDDQQFQSDDEVRRVNGVIADLRHEMEGVTRRLDNIVSEIEEFGGSDRLRERRRALEATEEELKARIAAQAVALELARGKVEPSEHIRRVKEIRADMDDDGDVGLKARATVKISLNDLIERVHFCRWGTVIVRLVAAAETIVIRPDGQTSTFALVDWGGHPIGQNAKEKDIIEDYLRRKGDQLPIGEGGTTTIDLTTIKSFYEGMTTEDIDGLEDAIRLVQGLDY